MPAPTKIRTRFAPSPSGYLHLGHGYSALVAYDFARAGGGAFVLRIEDIDLSRARPEFETAIFEDLAWLGVSWEAPVRRQSDHLADYEKIIAGLGARGLTYPCFCTRKEIAAEIEGAASAPHGPAAGLVTGPDGPLYPGTCKGLGEGKRQQRMEAGASFAVRLDSARASEVLEEACLLPLSYQLASVEAPLQSEEKPVDPHLFGDIVLARKDVPTSYHLSVVHDDALQEITHVVRGDDLADAVHIHRVLQALLGYRAPIYIHHRLIRDETGKRLAKRDKARTLRAMRESGATPADIRGQLGLTKNGPASIDAKQARP